MFIIYDFPSIDGWYDVPMWKVIFKHFISSFQNLLVKYMSLSLKIEFGNPLCENISFIKISTHSVAVSVFQVGMKWDCFKKWPTIANNALLLWMINGNPRTKSIEMLVQVPFGISHGNTSPGLILSYLFSI